IDHSLCGLQYLDRVLQQGETLITTGLRQTICASHRVRLEHDDRFAAEARGEVSNPCAVSARVGAAARGVGAAVAIGNVVGYEDGRRSLLRRARDAAGDVTANVAVPVAHPLRDGLLRDTIHERRVVRTRGAPSVRLALCGRI